MSEDPSTNPLEEPKAFDWPQDDDRTGKDGRSHFDSLLGAMFAGAIGTFALLLTFPACVSGATGSTRLQWSKQHTEIESTITAQEEIVNQQKDAPAIPD